MQKTQPQDQDKQEHLNCKKISHSGQKLIFFKFSENSDQILQCLKCNLDDDKEYNKISIDQILNYPVSKIKNFPPFKDKKDLKEIQNIMENFSKEKIQKFNKELKTEIEDFYNKLEKNINNFLFKSKQEVFQYLEKIQEITDISDFYDIQPVKEMIKQYQNKEINFDQLFQKQLEIKKNFEDEKKFEKTMNQEKNQKEIKNLIENLKQQLDQQLDIFKNNVNQNTEEIKNFSKNQNNIKFYKSNFSGNSKEEIEIQNNGRKIQLSKTVLDPKIVHTNNLDKNKTYHFKIKINFHQQNYQYLGFFMIGSNDADKHLGNQNFVCLNNVDENCAGGGESKIFEGQNFTDFWKNDETILNVVLNYQEKLLEIYDDDKQAYVKNTIDQKNVNGDHIMLGILACQFHEEKIDLSVTDILVY
ncbi:hypothetical protein PPERSA_03381 [Pseudocohnilembus persalinus]|uniref:Uncharacterized protein n=1 Tax=Pseudocohnilembus persalinus TaxID=266149 RepID=A0A0V0QLZ0_PSEPJ|nr:hypothetical protein PPERSA_03381 [Pseudocohnilembus persalinus]|eukprot:KRX03266.1 hypothetical protein PPERSA_03381 [Pseudocohnilembus persalinus]